MHRLNQYAGIRIDSSRGVIARCVEQRMESLALDDVDSYMSAFDDSINARAEWLALIDLLTVKETRFFRQTQAFDCVADYVEGLLRQDAAPGELSFWSAGCSTGQEAYSLGMVVERIVRQHRPWLVHRAFDPLTDAFFSQQSAAHQQCAVRGLQHYFLPERTDLLPA